MNTFNYPSKLNYKSKFQIVHKWIPFHKEPLHCSHLDKTIVLLKIGERFVPIVESAIKIVEPKPFEASIMTTETSSSTQPHISLNPENLSQEDAKPSECWSRHKFLWYISFWNEFRTKNKRRYID